MKMFFTMNQKRILAPDYRFRFWKIKNIAPQMLEIWSAGLHNNFYHPGQCLVIIAFEKIKITVACIIEVMQNIIWIMEVGCSGDIGASIAV